MCHASCSGGLREHRRKTKSNGTRSFRLAARPVISLAGRSLNIERVNEILGVLNIGLARRKRAFSLLVRKRNLLLFS